MQNPAINEIVATLAAARRCLQPDGIIIARFPSGDSPFARSIQYSDLTHKTVIGTGIVRQLAQQTGFEVLQIRAPVLPVLGVGPIRGLRRFAVLLLRNAVTTLINLTFHDAESLVVARNMLIVLQPRGEGGA